MVDSLSGQTYTVIVVADPVSNEQVAAIRQGYEQLYSELSPLLKQSLILMTVIHYPSLSQLQKVLLIQLVQV